MRGRRGGSPRRKFATPDLAKGRNHEEIGLRMLERSSKDEFLEQAIEHAFNNVEAMTIGTLVVNVPWLGSS